MGRRGQTYQSLERYEETLADFNRAIELDPNGGAIGRRGETYQLLELYEKALADFNRAIELDLGSDMAIAERGESDRLMGCGPSIWFTGRAMHSGATLADGAPSSWMPGSRYLRRRITPGSCADVQLVEGDLTTDITATWAIAGVWRRGTAVAR